MTALSPPHRAGLPSGDVEPPAAVLELAGGAPTTAVWRNEVGGLTFRVDAEGRSRFVKWDPAGSGEGLEGERARMEWLEGRFPAPRVVAYGRDEAGEWLATAALQGLSAAVPPWTGLPEVAVPAIAHGLRRLHETFDPAECPFEWSVGTRLAEAERAGKAVPAWLRDPPPVDRLVVCHGDPCSPNTLIDAAGAFLAIVDVGRLGIADRWADLVVASMSLEWNYGPGFEGPFFAAYGTDPDPGRIAYYRALWDAT